MKRLIKPIVLGILVVGMVQQTQASESWPKKIMVASKPLMHLCHPVAPFLVAGFYLSYLPVVKPEKIPGFCKDMLLMTGMYACTGMVRFKYEQREIKKRVQNSYASILRSADLDGLKQLLKKYPDHDYSLMTPITHPASEVFSYDALRLLLQYGKCHKIEEAFLEAMMVKKYENVVRLLLPYMDVNYTYENGCTPLHYACGWGRVNMVKLLLKAGADVTIKNNMGETPYDNAMMCRDNYQHWQRDEHGWQQHRDTYQNSCAILELLESYYETVFKGLSEPRLKKKQLLETPEQRELHQLGTHMKKLPDHLRAQIAHCLVKVPEPASQGLQQLFEQQPKDAQDN